MSFESELDSSLPSSDRQHMKNLDVCPNCGEQKNIKSKWFWQYKECLACNTVWSDCGTVYMPDGSKIDAKSDKLNGSNTISYLIIPLVILFFIMPYYQNVQLIHSLNNVINIALILSTIVVIYAVSIKLSMQLLGYSGITWKQSFVCCFIVILHFSCLALICKAFPILKGAQNLITGPVLAYYIVGWYLSSYGKNTDGEPLGWKKAGNISAIVLIVSFLVFILIVGVAKYSFRIS